MVRRIVFATACMTALALSAPQAEQHSTLLSAGSASIADDSPDAYSLSLPTLSAEQLQRFRQGRDLFLQRWVVAPSAMGQWGRGPTSNGAACTDCHERNGRGRPPLSADEPLRSALLRLSVPGSGPNGAPLPHPAYGEQLQFQGVLGRVPGEAEALVSWRESRVVYPDGAVVALRAPLVRFTSANFGPLAHDTLMSLRSAPALIGIGLLEAIPDSALLALAQQQRSAGLSGRVNRTWDIADQRMVISRFGLKANQSSLRQQIAHAYLQDLGVTSNMFPEQDCPAPQRECREFPRSSSVELRPEQMDSIEFYLRALAVPARRDAHDAAVRRGEELFDRIGCAACHVPELRTGDFTALPQLAGQIIRPYSDLLLHDLGEGLSDGRPEFDAGTRDWRTPPLWGMGLAQRVNGNAFLLHDGRARSASEAILWHGGEASRTRDRFLSLDATQRAALLAFLASL